MCPHTQLTCTHTRALIHTAQILHTQFTVCIQANMHTHTELTRHTHAHRCTHSAHTVHIHMHTHIHSSHMPPLQSALTHTSHTYVHMCTQTCNSNTAHIILSTQTNEHACTHMELTWHTHTHTRTGYTHTCTCAHIAHTSMHTPRAFPSHVIYFAPQPWVIDQMNQEACAASSPLKTTYETEPPWAGESVWHLQTWKPLTDIIKPTLIVSWWLLTASVCQLGRKG